MNILQKTALTLGLTVAVAWNSLLNTHCDNQDDCNEDINPLDPACETNTGSSSTSSGGNTGSSSGMGSSSGSSSGIGSSSGGNTGSSSGMGSSSSSSGGGVVCDNEVEAGDYALWPDIEFTVIYEYPGEGELPLRIEMKLINFMSDLNENPDPTQFPYHGYILDLTTITEDGIDIEGTTSPGWVYKTVAEKDGETITEYFDVSRYPPANYPAETLQEKFLGRCFTYGGAAASSERDG